MSVADPRVAVRAALAAHLKARLSGVQVSENWPAPAVKLKVPAVTVVASPRVLTEYHAPRQWRVTPTVGAPPQRPQVDVLYSYGRATLKLQLDAWEQFEATRDALAARVEAAFNLHPRVTLAQGTQLQDLQAAPGLVLRVPGYYGALCEYVFEAVAGTLPESSDTAQRGEWRQAYQGVAYLFLLNQETVAQMKTATMKYSLNGDAPVAVQVAP